MRLERCRSIRQILLFSPFCQVQWIGIAHAVSIPGDFTFNGVVDSADYVVWRKSLGSESDDSLWRMNFGKSLISELGNELSLEVTVPEPVAAMLALLGLVGIILQCGRRTRMNCIA
jgi:hypothetical protein